jgi:Zn-dependent membrane protease YugP
MTGMFFDPLYLLFAAPGFLLAMWAQFKVKSSFNHYSRIAISRGMTGADVAAAILREKGVTGVRIEPVQGWLSDHYDPRSRTLRLSPDVFGGRAIAAAGVAAHEVGHAIQHAEAYRWLEMRSNLVPMLNITSTVAMPAMIIGLMLSTGGSIFGQGIMLIGLALFGVMVIFQIITLPVEFDASRRALLAIEHGGIVTGEELAGARKVLSAAALTYVAAAISSIMTLLYFLLRSGLLGRRDD